MKQVLSGPFMLSRRARVPAAIERPCLHHQNLMEAGVHPLPPKLLRASHWGSELCKLKVDIFTGPNTDLKKVGAEY